MADREQSERLVEIPIERPIWHRFFMVAPLVLVGTREEDGAADFAPKHMVTPMGWQNYFGFVCAPTHSTCRNIDRTGMFTVSFPRPEQVLHASLAASPRERGGTKPVLDYFDTMPAREVEGDLLEGAYLYFECRHYKTIDGFGDNCLITGEIVAACADADFLRSDHVDDQELVHDSPLFAYLAPGRFAAIERSTAFPFPVDMKK